MALAAEPAGPAGPVLSPGDETLIAQARLVHEWRRFPFLDPQLPGELLPVRWSGTVAARLFHARHSEWAGRARLRWDLPGQVC